MLQLSWTHWEIQLWASYPQAWNRAADRDLESFMVMVTHEKLFPVRNDCRIQWESLVVDFYVSPEWINGQEEIRFGELKSENVTGFYLHNLHLTCGRERRGSNGANERTGTGLVYTYCLNCSRRYLKKTPSKYKQVGVLVSTTEHET